jgi:hypothetical protein
MRSVIFSAALALVVVASLPSVSSAEVFPPNFFRCAADQLFGHPSDGAMAAGRTGFGRTRWARGAYAFWKFGPTPSSSHANRFWLASFNGDVDDFALNQNTDLYPVYWNTPADALWVGPGPAASLNWRGITQQEIASIPYQNQWDLPTGVAIDALCEAGCYVPDQQIRVGATSVSVARAHESGGRALTTLAPNSTIDSIELMQNTIARWTVDIAPARQTIVTLHMKSGGELRVTPEHPLVTSEGVMRQAQALVVGDSLVRDDGSSDPVMSSTRSEEFTKVYNLRPTTTDLTSNILVAQGYLTGSARYQNEYIKYLNRVLFRSKVPVGVIPRSAAAHN